MNTTAYKGRLEEEKARLEKELGTIGRRNPSNPGDWEAVPTETGQEPDPNDRADQMEEYGENNAILDNCHVRVAFATNDERTAITLVDLYYKVGQPVNAVGELDNYLKHAGFTVEPHA